MGGFTERLVLNNETLDNIIYDEHIVRYQLVRPFSLGKRVLDLASGSGYGSHLLAGQALEVIGLDASLDAVESAKKNYHLPNLKYLVGQAESLEYPDKHFDLIVSFETIEHLKDQEKYLGELKRVISEDGLVFISTPNREAFKEKNPFHLREFTKTEFSKLLANYFPYIQILEQGNAYASVIKGIGKAQANFSQAIKPLYFIAVCSKREIKEEFITNLSLNQSALDKLQNNPILKVSDKVYRLFHKLKG